MIGGEGSHACSQKQDTVLGASSWKGTIQNLEGSVAENESPSRRHLLPPGLPGFLQSTVLVDNGRNTLCEPDGPVNLAV